MLQTSKNKTPIGLVLYFIKYYKTTKTFKAILFYLYRYTKRMFLDLNTEKIIKVNGYHMKIIPNDRGISRELLLFKTHEPLTTELTKTELKEGMICIDIGSNIGYYALLESNMIGEKGKVIAIEPSPKNLDYLINNLKIQKNSNAEIHHVAIGNFNGTTKLTIGDKSNHCKVVLEDQTIPDDLDVINIPIKKLDTFIHEQNILKVDFIRMDVEGSELHVVEGMKSVLKKFKPIIQIEVHKTFLGVNNTKKLLSILKDEAYDVKYYIPKDLENPIIGNLNDVKNYDINKILEMIDKDVVPDFFILFLEKKIV